MFLEFGFVDSYDQYVYKPFLLFKIGGDSSETTEHEQTEFEEGIQEGDSGTPKER